jgi:hypothetical protein
MRIRRPGESGKNKNSATDRIGTERDPAKNRTRQRTGFDKNRDPAKIEAEALEGLPTRNGRSRIWELVAAHSGMRASDGARGEGFDLVRVSL